jgi:hypothetical protein
MDESMYENIWIASFDIGKVNFSFYIEEINLTKLNDVQNISKLKRYNPNGTCSSDFVKIIKNIYSNGKKILIKNVNLTKDADKNKYFDFELCHNLTDVLDEYSNYWDNVSYFVVEQQMSFGKKINTMALKIAQHTESYFMFRYGRFKKVIEFPAYYKTQILGCEKIEKKTKKGKVSYKNIDQRARKKWAIEEGSSVLIERNDFNTLSEISSNKKCDDYFDTIIQLQAFKYLYFVEKMKF